MKKRYGTNPYGSGHPSGRGEAADGTPILYFQCANSQEICYTYYVANPGDGLNDLTAIQDSGIWYEAQFGGTVNIGNGIYEDQINFLP